MSVKSDQAQPDRRMIKLDGSSGEGGGQILRTSLTLSLLTGKPFELSKIRANRSNPGLRPQHLKAVEVAAAIGEAGLTGAKLRSSLVRFVPRGIAADCRTIDIGTAGSTGLVLQTIHLPLAMRADRPVRITLIGGTFNPSAPAFSFLDETWKAFLRSFGMPISLSMLQAGFFPLGGGRIEAVVEPGQPTPFRQTTRGRLNRIRVIAGIANLPGHVAERMRKRASARLDSIPAGCDIAFEAVDWPSAGKGAALTIVAEHEGSIPATFVGLGELGKPAEDVADEAVDQLLAFEAIQDAAVDPHSADQILLPLALAEGESVFTVSEVTEHLRTNVATIRAFLDRSIAIEEPDGTDRPGRVTIA